MLISRRESWIMLKSIAKAEKLNLSIKKEYDMALDMFKKVAIQNGIVIIK